MDALTGPDLSEHEPSRLGAEGDRGDPGAADDPSGDAPSADADPTPRDADWADRFGARLVAVPASSWITLVVVVAAVLLVTSVLEWRMIVRDTLPTGGDMGAHVWGPAYLRDHLLSNWRVVGWTPDWYTGFPAFQFYMLLPSLAIVVLNGFLPFAIGGVVTLLVLAFLAVRATEARRRRNLVIGALAVAAFTLVTAIGMPYGPAFKVVAVSGIVSLPICAWAFGRLVGLPYPGPALLSLATLPFLFDRSFNIYGGNIASTMAGEFAFSMSLSLSVLAAGLTINAQNTGRNRGWAALVFALAGLCHIFPAVWAVALCGAYLLTRPTVRGLVSTLTVLPVAGLLGAFWALPFFWKRTYLNDMGWEKIELFKSYLLTRNQLNPANVLRDSPPLEVVFGLAVVGLVLCVARRNRLGIALALSAFAIGLLFIHLPQLRLWNARILPFYYLSLYFLGALAVYESIQLVVAKVWARWYVAYALGGLAIVEVLRFAADGTSWQFRVARVLPGEGATASGALLVAGLATLVSARRGGNRLLFAPGAGLVWVVAALVPDAWATASAGGQWADGTQQAVWVTMHVAQYFAAYGLFGLVLVEVLDLVADTRFLAERETGTVLRWASAPLVFLALWLVFGLSLRKLPGGDVEDGAYRWGIPGLELSTTDQSFLNGWATWNFRGIELKEPTASSGGYPEYYDLVQMVDAVGDEHGCGRSMWEYGPRLEGYGTPMAPMLLPHFTDGCIGSMEGLFFEASSTTPFHFLNQSALSKEPSSAQRDLPYPGFDIDLGIEQLQLMGVRYYLAFSDTAVAAAQAHPDLTEVATTADDNSQGPWHMFLVADSELVTPLQFSPVVYDNVDETQHEWLQPAAALFNDPETYDVLRAASGPDAWPRYEVPEVAKSSRAEVDEQRAAAAEAGEAFVEPKLPEPERVELPDVVVTGVTTDRSTIEFDVDRVGVPVLVKTSYFPNWKVDGADGPYRVTPNFMVVIPTDTHVRLHYGYIGIDYVSYALTAVGIVLLVLLFRRRPDPSDPTRDARLAFAYGTAPPVAEPVEPLEPAEPIEPVEPSEPPERPAPW